MNSDTSETLSSEVVSKPKSRLIKIALVALVVIIVVGIVLVCWWFSRPQTPWLFKGAYAKYRGETTVSIWAINMTIRLEVVDYNSTHAKLLTYMKMDMDSIESKEYQNTTWAELRESNYEVEGYTLKRSYEDHIYFEELGTRLCVVYEYSSADMTMTYYVDKEIGFPIKMAFSMNDYSFELILTETNIPGLKK